LPYIKWVASFLTDKEVAVCIDGQMGKMKPVNNGIPQGSPVSPILAGFYMAELLEQFADSAILFPAVRNHILLPDNPTPIILFIYVNNGKIFISLKSLETNVAILQCIYYRVASWLKQARLAPDLAKWELMHYICRRKDGSPPNSYYGKQ
jgi:hypothetical protein